MGFPLYPISVAAGANKIPKSGSDGKIATGYIPDLSGIYLSIAAAAASYQVLSAKNVANGYAGLNASGVVARAQGGMGGALGALFNVVGNIDNASYPAIAAKYVQAPGGAAGADIDLYTVPTGKRALGIWTLYNQNLTAITNARQVKIPSVDNTGYFHCVLSGASVASLAEAQDQSTQVFQAGDVISAHITATALALTSVSVSGGTTTYNGTITGGGSNAYAGKVVVIEGFVNGVNNGTFTVVGSSTTSFTVTTVTQTNETHAAQAYEQTGVSFWIEIGIFDDTSPLKSVRIASLTLPSGENTLYTCPVGKQAVMAPLNLVGSATNGLMVYFNQSGSTVTLLGSVVPSGQAVDATRRFFTTTGIANNGQALQNLNNNFAAGDFVSLNTNQTGKQIAWTTVQEYAA